MAILDTNRSFSAAPSVGDRLSYALSMIHGKALDWYERRQTRRTLSALSDRELDDIGLSRGDLYRMF